MTASPCTVRDEACAGGGVPRRRAAWRRLAAAVAALAAVCGAAGPLPARGEGDAFELARAAYDAKAYAQARQALVPLAENGDARAQHLLGLMYEKGRGVEKDFATAARWYARAARAGYAPSEYRLAVGYLCGLGGLEKDSAQALALLRRSAEGGYDKARRVLAEVEAHGGEQALRSAKVALSCWAFSLK